MNVMVLVAVGKMDKELFSFHNPSVSILRCQLSIINYSSYLPVLEPQPTNSFIPS
ncbi:MAG TPA: hypothetical protein DEB17_08920 [Chlorobaculum sp.]|uniref:Uncharacterized protein n=1 Tax=Chlorobaculum tepidum (strain ATCC 49652 / DSM 12025 / NBRC 103806 / TLS) TaxID=194439 RepID=Q8KES4_CHLTE|nr:hypothetical protein CT0608 [Chlorobaculum tepidum TLS]HBU24089.1 hypothetical protein [Chlorobaculum sp.]